MNESLVNVALGMIISMASQMVGVDLKPIEAEARATIKAQTADEIKALKAQIAPKPKAAPGDTQHAPAAQPSGVAFTQGVTWPKTRKPKTTAAEAKAQIAAAMQSEGGDESGADAPGIEATASGFALAVGARVKVLPSADTGGPAVRLWIGKKGTVSGKVGPKAWDVTFDAKVAKPITGKAAEAVQSFHVTELEVVE